MSKNSSGGVSYRPYVFTDWQVWNGSQYVHSSYASQQISTGFTSPDSPIWGRTWDNTVVGPSNGHKWSKEAWPMKLVAKTVFTGPKLGYKIYVKGGTAWARKPVQVFALQKVFTPKKNKKKRNAWLSKPNALSYSKLSVESGGSTSITYTVPGAARFVVSGVALWGNYFFPLTGAGQPLIEMSAGFSGVQHQKIAAAIVQADAIALKRFYAHAKGLDSNLAQDLAERAQTSRLISDTAVRIAKGLHDLRRGNIAQAVKSLLPNSPKGVASDYLAVQYGVKPLLSSINGLAKHFATPQAPEFTITGSCKIEVPSTLVGTWGNRGNVSTSASEYISGFVTVKYVSKVKVLLPATRSIAQLGFENPADLLYQLLPWTFVLDWFLPLGEYLSNMDAFAGLQVLSTHKTIVWKQTSSFSRLYGGVTNGCTTSAGTAFYNATKFSCQRSILSTPPTLGFPSFKNPASQTHVANAIALITAYSKRK